MSSYKYHRRQRPGGLSHPWDPGRFKRTHETHYRTLREVEDFLKSRRVRYHKIWRGRRTDTSRYGLIVTVGGDGTFLEAARNIARQPIVGINSDPQWSVGRYCAADGQNFRKILARILEGKARVTKLFRLRLTALETGDSLAVLNDILVCHRVPAAVSRYLLMIGRSQKEEQRGSGLWVATASGSTGVVRVAGGKILPWTSRRWQYRPRELNDTLAGPYALKGGILGPRQALRICSLMNDGIIFIDGAHRWMPFPFGAKVSVRQDPTPLQSVA